MFVLFYVQVAALRRADTPSKESYGAIDAEVCHSVGEILPESRYNEVDFKLTP